MIQLCRSHIPFNCFTMGVRVNCKTIDDGFTELPATLWAFVDIILNRILELVGWYCNFVYTITLVAVLQSFIDESSRWHPWWEWNSDKEYFLVIEQCSISLHLSNVISSTHSCSSVYTRKKVSPVPTTAWQTVLELCSINKVTSVCKSKFASIGIVQHFLPQP
jgi:hypothetical protein